MVGDIIIIILGWEPKSQGSQDYLIISLLNVIHPKHSLCKFCLDAKADIPLDVFIFYKQSVEGGHDK